MTLNICSYLEAGGRPATLILAGILLSGGGCILCGEAHEAMEQAHVRRDGKVIASFGVTGIARENAGLVKSLVKGPPEQQGSRSCCQRQGSEQHICCNLTSSQVLGKAVPLCCWWKSMASTSPSVSSRDAARNPACKLTLFTTSIANGTIL